MITIPLLQLVLFGYAINTTPRDLPTAVLLQESSDVGRSILAALQNTKYFKVTQQLHGDDSRRKVVRTIHPTNGPSSSHDRWAHCFPPRFVFEKPSVSVRSNRYIMGSWFADRLLAILWTYLVVRGFGRRRGSAQR